MSEQKPLDDHIESTNDEAGESVPESSENEASKEVGGREGPEPTRFGDWEKNGRCIDF